MHIDEQICIETNDGEYYGESPAVAKGVPQRSAFGAEPAPVAANGLIVVQNEPNKALKVISIHINITRRRKGILVHDGTNQMPSVSRNLVDLRD